MAGPGYEVADVFGANLARHRHKAGLSQEELADRASLHRTEISPLETGIRLARIDTVVKLAGALGGASRRSLRRVGLGGGRTRHRPLSR